MPSYNAGPVPSLIPGQQIALVNNAATDTGITKTQQVQIPYSPDDPDSIITIVNSTNAQGTVAVAATDVGVSAYLPLTNENAIAIVAPNGGSTNFRCRGPYVLVTFGSAPTSGSLIMYR